MLRSKLARRLALAALPILAAAALAYGVLLRPREVAAVAVAEGAVVRRVTGPGTVQARVPVTLAARTSAQVVALHADQGDLVRRGQLLAVLDDRDLAARRAAAAASRDAVASNIRAAEAALEKAQAELELSRAKQRRDAEVFRSGFISQAALDSSSAALRAAEASLDNAKAALDARRNEARVVGHESQYADTLWSHTRVVAPIDGLVIQRSVEVGTMVVPASPMFRLVDPATVWVTMRVDESVLGQVAIGMPARIRLRTGEEIPGRVARIAHQSDAATRELAVDVAFDRPPGRIAIDQEAQVAIVAGNSKGLVVPASAILRLPDQRAGVMVVREGRARLQPIATGASDGERVLVADGLAAGEAVLADPRAAKPGQRVRPAAAR
jgi:RND family efflux transporter MFP subunit